jgi:predicted transcriptional regulator
MTERNRTHRPPTPLQQAILDVLWSKGPATAEVVREALAPRYPLKDSTVRTLLRRPEAQGHVTHRVEGKVFVYRATVKPHRLAARAVRQVIDRFCSGSVEQFLLGMVEEEVLDPKAIERIAKQIRGRK